MDARPFRPRGGENAVPSLHQRHKSTGNLSSKPLNGVNPGFRGPAKRAAFGDVTNTTKHHNVVGLGRDGHKVHKAHSVLNLDRSSLNSNAAKENTISVSKDPLTRPAEKAQPLSSKSANISISIGSSRNNTDAGKAPAKKSSVVTVDVKPAAVGRESLLSAREDTRGTHTETQAVEPRHRQSQPRLKQPQPEPAPRKTQGRDLDSLTCQDLVGRHDARDKEPDVSLPPLSDAPTHSAQLTSAASSDRDSAATVSSEAYDVLPSDQMDMVARILRAQDDTTLDELIGGHGQDEPAVPALSVTYGEPAVEAVGPAADNQTTTLSETEEQWYDDEESCEDDDQGYTTSHSLRSRDMTGGVTTLLQPRVTSRVQRELDEAKAEVLATRPPEDVDDEAWDVSMVAEYGDEIFDYLREMEVKMLPNPHYMEHQTEIQWSMRAVLMEWLVQVHGRFHLLPETLFLTVNYVDRFLSSKVVSIGKLQLVGATAILVASKYEEINCPSLQEIVYMVDGGYSAEEVLKAERFMLSMLGFELGWPGPMSFLRRVSKADDYDYDTRTLAKYFLELTIMDERFVASTPSFLAAGAHCLSRLILNKGPWTKAHVHYSGYTWGQLKPLVTMMIECCDDPDNHHRAVFDKYAEKKFKEASVMVQSVLDAGFTLPHDTMPVRVRQAGHAGASYMDDLNMQPAPLSIA
ncbi:Cyclin, C-terminal domain [Geosmithia morbida]|uniref:Cyclin, C-terminal domain n=1 Tax=Geosmithia morbida TaxID=1094350 RepID=A0A9P4YPZ4_9HYPO|nr:Cyclin, C-terminal domain [Geosmithia morbida]KAF4119593.1 Cyclin, C-terminal domain [Geosmithia morbida]